MLPVHSIRYVQTAGVKPPKTAVARLKASEKPAVRTSGGKERLPDVHGVVAVHDEVVHFEKVAARYANDGAQIGFSFIGGNHAGNLPGTARKEKEKKSSRADSAGCKPSRDLPALPVVPIVKVIMSTETAPAAKPAYSFKHPFPARHLVNYKLTGPGSEKETRHHEISLAGSDITYLAGDALGLMPVNCPDLVEELITALYATGDESVPGRDGQPKSLREALRADYAITFADRKFIEAGGQRGVAELHAMVAPEKAAELRHYLQGKNELRDYVDILNEFPQLAFTPEEFVKLLGKLKPRLYSIASSQKASPDEVHLTVVNVTYNVRGRARKGVASTFLSERWPADRTAGVWVQNQQKHFSLPADGNTPAIMVGPGTGVAPFRAFMEERQALGAKGRNWLFFGEQRRASDFFYEPQFTQWERDGFMRLDTAFSRDQAHKIYVQHKLLERAKDIWAWLDDGAEFFICGDKERMAEDVHQALLKIVETEGGKTPEEALEYVETMRKIKRYKRDVY